MAPLLPLLAFGHQQSNQVRGSTATAAVEAAASEAVIQPAAAGLCELHLLAHLSDCTHLFEIRGLGTHIHNYAIISIVCVCVGMSARHEPKTRRFCNTYLLLPSSPPPLLLQSALVYRETPATNRENPMLPQLRRPTKTTTTTATNTGCRCLR